MVYPLDQIQTNQKVSDWLTNV